MRRGYNDIIPNSPGHATPYKPLSKRGNILAKNLLILNNTSDGYISRPAIVTIPSFANMSISDEEENGKRHSTRNVN